MSNQSRASLVFRALAHANRRKILDLLRDAPRTTGELCAHFKRADRCTVMMHLKVLAAAELILVERRGRERWNYLNVTPFQDLYERWIHRYAQPSASLLLRLKRDLEP
jgi:DNA-binding transcriptional ArsR family regulator